MKTTRLILCLFLTMTIQLIADQGPRYFTHFEGVKSYCTIEWNDLNGHPIKSSKVIIKDDFKLYFDAADKAISSHFKIDISKCKRKFGSVRFSYLEKDGEKRWFAIVMIHLTEVDHERVSIRQGSFNIIMSLDAKTQPILKDNG